MILSIGQVWRYVMRLKRLEDKMKTLAQYLAEYIETEICRVADDEILPNLQEWIEQGIDAYQSTENCRISVIGLGGIK